MIAEHVALGVTNVVQELIFPAELGILGKDHIANLDNFISPNDWDGRYTVIEIRVTDWVKANLNVIRILHGPLSLLKGFFWAHVDKGALHGLERVLLLTGCNVKRVFLLANSKLNILQNHRTPIRQRFTSGRRCNLWLGLVDSNHRNTMLTLGINVQARTNPRSVRDLSVYLFSLNHIQSVRHLLGRGWLLGAGKHIDRCKLIHRSVVLFSRRQT